jgi:hypothetical protein
MKDACTSKAQDPIVLQNLAVQIHSRADIVEYQIRNSSDIVDHYTRNCSDTVTYHTRNCSGMPEYHTRNYPVEGEHPLVPRTQLWALVLPLTSPQQTKIRHSQIEVVVHTKVPFAYLSLLYFSFKNNVTPR